MLGSLSRELNEIFYTIYRWCIAGGNKPAARYIALVLFCTVALAAMTVVLGLVAYFVGAESFPALGGRSSVKGVGGLAVVLVLGTYYGYASEQKVAFLESDYLDESPREARLRQVRVATIVVLLMLSVWQTLRLLTRG